MKTRNKRKIQLASILVGNLAENREGNNTNLDVMSVFIRNYLIRDHHNFTFEY